MKVLMSSGRKCVKGTDDFIGDFFWKMLTLGEDNSIKTHLEIKNILWEVRCLSGGNILSNYTCMLLNIFCLTNVFFYIL